MERNQSFCPMCPNHCASGAEKCERGKEYFKNGGHVENHQWHVHGMHRKTHHPHFEGDIPKGSLTSLFMECGHHLFHGLHHHGGTSDAELFESLSDDEKAALKEMLAKLLAAWQKHP